MAIFCSPRKARMRAGCNIYEWRVDHAAALLHHIPMKKALFICAVWLGGCASVDTHLPEISLPSLSAERAEQESMAFSEIQRLHDRLGRIASPVLNANAELCPKTQYDIGVRTHKLSQYPKAVRPAAARELGAKSAPSVSYIVPGSPGERAGLLSGDELLDSNNKPIEPSHKAFQNQLRADGNIRVRRNADILSVKTEPDLSCGYKVRLSVSSDINAYANGRHIIVTSGMMNFVETDEELALIIGHELAHNTMSHIRKSITNAILSGLATRYTRPFESEADYVGMYYLVRAGYDPAGVEDVWRRLALVNPKAVARAKTHPTYPDRYLRIAAARKEIEEKQAAGLPIIPNFKTGS